MFWNICSNTIELRYHFFKVGEDEEKGGCQCENDLRECGYLFLSLSPVLSPVQVSLLNYVFLASWAFALPYSQYRPLASSICTVWTCVIIVCKMLYQLKSIDPHKPNCTIYMVNMMTLQFFDPCNTIIIIIIKSYLKQTCSIYWATGTHEHTSHTALIFFSTVNLTTGRVSHS